MLLSNKNFYPTPDKLIDRMIAKIQGEPVKILDPSAGSGAILSRLNKVYHHNWSAPKYRLENLYAIEIDENLQAILQGHHFKLIDSDFLTFSGPDKFDLIMANPPFDHGDLHLLKAIDIMYRGQIIFLLNAETIRNPFTNTRKDLAKKLRDLNAEIEFIPDAFLTADRPTKVEVALINIVIERKVEEDLFAGVDDEVKKEQPTIEKNYEVSNKRYIEELVAEYNQVVRIGTETIMAYFRNYPKICKYIQLNKELDKYSSPHADMTAKMLSVFDEFLVTVRKDFWRRTLELKEVYSRMTSNKQKEFNAQVEYRCNMDFTERNIRQFILNLVHGYKQTMTEATLEIFDKFTVSHCYSSGLYDENIHYFNGWKTNKAFKVNKKVIIPIYAGYDGGPFYDNTFKKWKLAWDAYGLLNDIDKVMNLFDGKASYYGIADAITHAFDHNKSNKGIESTYFTITCYKKGTIHLTFNNEDILARFNLAACLGKEWLPHDYGSKPYADCSPEEKKLINEFESMASYNKNFGRPLFAINQKLLEMAA